MKLALVYAKDDHKLQDDTYSWIYKGMMDALVERFEHVTHIHDDCYYADIDADLIMFYDVHATHHIRIDGLKSHPAMKMEYVSDPNQEELRGVVRQFNRRFHKLGRRQRVDRFFERGLDYIVCPFRDGFYEWMGEYMGKDAEEMLLWFPLAPTAKVKYDVRTNLRKPRVLANGSVADGGKNIYKFRREVFKSSVVDFVEHWIHNKETPSGQGYLNFISQWAGALALHDYFPVPKYFEMPIAGCVTFAQHYPEYEYLGFKDYETCIYINRDNYEDRIKQFLVDPSMYQSIADAGRKLVEENYTSEHFADFIYDFVLSRGCR